MPIQNSNNQKYSNNSDGWELAGGTTPRKLTLIGGDTIISGSGSSIITFPSSTSTLSTLLLTESLSNKTLISPIVSGTLMVTGSVIITGSLTSYIAYIGSNAAPVLHTSSTATINSGSTVIYNVLTSSYDCAFFDYMIKNSTGSRAGNIMAVWSGSSVSFSETVTPSLGNTTGFVFGVILSGSNMVLTSSVTSDGWLLKTSIRTI